jgi:predicted NAD/FAD-binding protein
VREEGDSVLVRTARGGERRFDQAVIATHADDAVKLIGELTGPRQMLSSVRYNRCRVVLHTDSSVMPQSPGRWLSWNYGRTSIDGVPKCYVAYYMNRLQGFNANKQYFVTLDYPGPIDPASIVREFDYTHPIIDVHVRNMQRALYAINDVGRIRFCGSYFHSKKIGPDLIGSHEAGFASGLEAARVVLRHRESEKFCARRAS